MPKTLAPRAAEGRGKHDHTFPSSLSGRHAIDYLRTSYMKPLANGLLDAAAFLALPLTLSAQERVLLDAATRSPDPRWAGLPLLPFSGDPLPAMAALAIAALALIQCLALWLLWRSLKARALSGWRTALFAFAIVASALVAFGSHVRSSDVFSYVGYAVLPGNPYSPGSAVLSPPFQPIEAIWGRPVSPCLYGPLWLAIDRLALSHVASIADGLMRERILGLVGFAALIAASRAAGAPTAVLVILALNPAVWRLWVADAHMDLPAIACIVAAWAFACKRKPYATLVLIVAAGLYKITLAAVALAAIDGPNRRTRIGLAIGSVSVTVAISWLWAGHPYFDALRGVGRLQYSGGLLGVLHAAAAAIALGAVAAAVLLGYTARAGTWTFATLGSKLMPWYLVWGYPYALRAGYAATFLIAFPFAAAMFGTVANWIGYVTLTVLTALALRGQMRGRPVPIREPRIAPSA